MPTQHHDAGDEQRQADGQPQRCQHPEPWHGGDARQAQADEQQCKALKEVWTVDGDVLVFHDLPPLDWLFMLCLVE